MASKKGATEFDKKCHSIFDAKNDGRDYLARGVNLPCDNCGHELRAYYCEAQLYLVECEFCGIKALVKERSPQAAAHTYATVRFVRGRLKFGGARNSAPFPSMVVIFRGDV